jgi:predicted RNA-binding protein (virulence factor B family)
MLELGRRARLRILKSSDYGLFLDGENFGEVLLPKRYVTSEMTVGEDVDVMVFLDGEERVVATTEVPFAELNEFAFLKVNSVEKVGAFMDWGVSKDLFIPFAEQRVKMEAGRKYIVYIYLDPLTERLLGSSKLEKFFDKNLQQLQEGQEVDLIIWHATPLGYKAIINRRYEGLVYKSEVFRSLKTGDAIKGYIKTIRPDGKIDLSLDAKGYHKVDKYSQIILDLLKKAGGQLPYNDKTDPEVIYSIFRFSKKVFKMSLGKLYKEKLIEISDKGIRLI